MERRLKERLIGAAVLVLLAVIFIPMLLSDNTQYNSRITGSNIPARPSDDFNTRIIPLDEGQPQQQQQEAPPAADTGGQESPPSASAEMNGKARTAESTPTPPQTAAPASTRATAPTSTKATEKPEPAASAPPAKAMGVQAWIVQLGSFSSKKNAEELNTKLRAKGYTAFVEPLKQQSGLIYRVRVGPEIQRSDARKIRDKIHKSMHMDGLVIPYP